MTHSEIGQAAIKRAEDATIRAEAAMNDARGFADEAALSEIGNRAAETRGWLDVARLAMAGFGDLSLQRQIRAVNRATAAAQWADEASADADHATNDADEEALAEQATISCDQCGAPTKEQDIRVGLLDETLCPACHDKQGDQQ